MEKYVNKQNLLHDLINLKLSIEDYHQVEQFILNYDEIFVDNCKVVWYDRTKGDKK